MGPTQSTTGSISNLNGNTWGGMTSVESWEEYTNLIRRRKVRNGLMTTAFRKGLPLRTSTKISDFLTPPPCPQIQATSHTKVANYVLLKVPPGQCGRPKWNPPQLQNNWGTLRQSTRDTLMHSITILEFDISYFGRVERFRERGFLILRLLTRIVRNIGTFLAYVLDEEIGWTESAWVDAWSTTESIRVY